MSTNEKNTTTSASPLAGRSETKKAGSPATSNSTSTERRASGTSRLEKVSAKDLCDFKNGQQLVSVMHDAILAHQRLYEDAGIMHGDINPNTIVILETEDGKVEGALIDYDMPLCRAAMRKLRKPDPVVPPPASQWAQGYHLPTYFRRGPGI
ncbi:hypothetical protein LXA43DRAFT_104318 [Ganoderma leucocontextum]|nr:hypothetical protein LXA43DRAFT_104318 [Ganoderma leucocontextum]